MGVDGKTEVQAKRLAKLHLTLGAAEITAHDVAVIPRQIYPVSGPEVAGLCGADLWAGRGWRFDYPNRRLILSPVDHGAESLSKSADFNSHPQFR